MNRTRTFIVNGEDVYVRVDEHSLLLVSMQRALKVSHNTGRRIEDWEVRDVDGVLIDQVTPTMDVRPGNIFLTVRIGAGGARRAA